MSWELPPRRVLILIISGLITGMLLGAMDQTIVATAGPTIISELGGLSSYSWVFSSYVLTQTVAMPIFGKLSDLYGRKRFFILGLLVFMLGSALSGASQNILQLIFFRAIQGIGSGAFFPVAIAVIGVVFPPNLRGKVQGILASVWGTAAVVGPTVGSYLVEAIDWRWVFYINLPLGIISLILIYISLKETSDNNSVKIDWLGIFTLASWVLIVMFTFQGSGSIQSLYSYSTLLLLIIAAIFFLLFLHFEARADEPTIPLQLFRIRTVTSSALIAFLRGICFLVTVTFVPLFVQAAMGGNVNDGRNVLYFFFFPVVAGSLLGGQLATRRAYRGVAFGGLGLMSIGIFLLTGLSADVSYTYIFGSLVITGLGLGITFPTVVLAIQYSVERRQIGIASSLSQFMSNLGGTIGIALLGSLQVSYFTSKLTDLARSMQYKLSDNAAKLIADPDSAARIITSQDGISNLIGSDSSLANLIHSMREAFASSFVSIYWILLIISLIALGFSLFMRGSLRQQVSAKKN